MIESEQRYSNVRELPFDGYLTPSLQSERARIRPRFVRPRGYGLKATDPSLSHSWSSLEKAASGGGPRPSCGLFRRHQPEPGWYRISQTERNLGVRQ